LVVVGYSSRSGRARAGSSVEDASKGYISYTSKGCRKIEDWGVVSIALASFSVPCKEAYVAILALILG
jgi:hypothetical protein